MVFTQKLSPAPPTADQTQQQIIKYMPVVFSVFFFVCLSPFALLVINSGVSLGQQRYLYKKHGVLGEVGSGG